MANNLKGQKISRMSLSQRTKYKNFILEDIKKETGILDLEDLVFFLASNFYRKYQIKNKRGPKSKWNPMIRALLAVEVEMRSEKTVREAIERLLLDSSWKKMLPKSGDGFELFLTQYKSGRKNLGAYEYARYEYRAAMSDGYPSNWTNLVRTYIDSALNNEE